MLFDEKPIDSLTVQDIEFLISDSVCESHRLDYKASFWGANDEARREMLRDISAFANADGGYIVLGVVTERGLGAGDLECPTSIADLPHNNYAEMILRSCRDNFDPVCTNIEVSQIEMNAPNTVVVVIKVPQSLTAPHMITFKGLNQFWQRHGTDKQRMSTHEIRETMLSRISYEERLLRYAEKQGLEATQPGHTGHHPILRLWAAPIIPLTPEVDVNDRDLRQLLGPSLERDPFSYNCALYSGQPRAAFKGIEAWQLNEATAQYVELHRQGYLEFGTSMFTNTPTTEGASRSIVAIRFAIYADTFANLVIEVFSRLQLQGPLAFGCALVRASGLRLLFGSRSFDLSNSSWGRPDMDLNYTVTYDFNTDKSTIMRRINDRLWNAFNFDACPFYQTGEFVLPPR